MRADSRRLLLRGGGSTPNLAGGESADPPSCLRRPLWCPAIGWAGVKRGGSLKNTYSELNDCLRLFFFLAGGGGWKGENCRSGGEDPPRTCMWPFHEWPVYIQSFSGRKKMFTSPTLKAHCVRFSSKYWQVCRLQQFKQTHLPLKERL